MGGEGRWLEVVGASWQMTEPGMTQLEIAPDQRVTLQYVLLDELGDVVDEARSDQPLEYVHGYADVAPGLSRHLAGLRAGDRFEVTLAPDEGFGPYDEEGVFEVERASFSSVEEIVVGDSFVAKGVTGDDISMTVLEVYDDCLVVDTNHPLAGQTVRIQGEVADVRPADEEELTRARARSSAPPAPGGS